MSNQLQMVALPDNVSKGKIVLQPGESITIQAHDKSVVVKFKERK